MAYNLAVICSHRTHVLSVHIQMSTKEIMELIGSHFDITTDSFELQVYDKQFQRYIDFDDEYVEELRQILPRTHNETLSAEVLFQEARKTEIVSTLNDAPSPSYVPANSPGCMSASEDIRSTTPNIDLNLCFYDNSLPSPNNVQLNPQENFNSITRVLFVRDVAPYQRSQYQLNNCYRDARSTCFKKKNYIVRIQGVKTNCDKTSASILPEIKLPSIFLRQDRLTLVVAAVIEERNEEEVSWRLDISKGFLRDDVQTDTVHFNPFWLNINRSALTNDGIFKLPLRMCTISRNQGVKVGSIFYKLPLSDAQKLHSADYVSNISRLACVMADDNNNIQWSTFGLSDFMHPKYYGKRKVEEVNSITKNYDDHAEKQLESSNVSTSVFMIPNSETTFNLPKKHIRLTKKFTIALLGSRSAEMDGLISEIHQTVNPVAVFDKLKSFTEFLTQVQDQQVVLILFNCLDEAPIQLIHHFQQLYSIYVFGANNDKNDEWTKKWDKVIGIFSDIKTICQELQQITRRNESNCRPIGVTSISSNTDLIACNAEFMYFLMLKEILLQIQDNEKVKQDFADFSRLGVANNNAMSFLVNQFKQDYNCSSPIWWYTKESFIYSVVNQAMKQSDIGTIFKMRCFMQDIHNRYNRLQFLTTPNHNSLIGEDTIELANEFSNQFLQKAKQHQTTNKLAVEVGSIYDLYQQMERLNLKTGQTIQTTLYRGQAISTWEFEKLRQNQGGLLSFNSFLSTSTDRDVSYVFAESAQDNPDLIGVLFEMTIDTSASSKPFNLVNNINSCISENEVLFSMHSIFRIKEMKCVYSRLWEVNLILFNAYNKEFQYELVQHGQNLTNRSTRLRILGSLMIDMGEFEKAEKIYTTLPESEIQNSREDLAYLYNQLGRIKIVQSDFNSALSYYRTALIIQNNNLPCNNPELVRLLTNIDIVYKSLGRNSKSILYLRKALDMQQKSLAFAYPDVIMTYNSIGQLYSSRGEYTTALSYFQKAIEIQQNFHAPPYPFLALLYLNIGQVYYLMGDRSNALIFIQRGLEIYQQKSSFIPTESVGIYNIMDIVHKSMELYRTIATNYQKPLQLQETYLQLIYRDTVNKALTAEHVATKDYIKNLFKSQVRPKSDSKHFVATTADNEWINFYKNVDKIANENREHMKQWLLKVPLKKLLDEIDTGYIDKMKFSSEKCREKIKDYMKITIDWEQPAGLVRAYTSGGTGFYAKLNYDLAKIESNRRFRSTQNRFDSGYLDNEAPKGHGEHIIAAILINHPIFQPYYYTGTTYRGMRITREELAKYNVGNIVLTRSFLSTSKDEHVVKHFMPVNGAGKELIICRYKVKNPRSSLFIKDLSEFPKEKEVLIVPFAAFRIIKVDNIDMDVSGKSNPFRVISLEECDLN